MKKFIKILFLLLIIFASSSFLLSILVDDSNKPVSDLIELSETEIIF